MLNYDDPRWETLRGGYKVPYNPVPTLRKLETGIAVQDAWEELWNELHHQGDVGEASYAAVPHLVRIHKEKRNLDWSLYAVASIIEIERHRRTNPLLPDWLKRDYENAWRELTKLAIEDLVSANDRTTVQSLLASIALGKGLLTMGAIIAEFTEDERIEILDGYGGGWSNDYQ
jgi:hypothetical protein